MSKVSVFTTIVGDASEGVIGAEGCFKVEIENRSTGPVVVNGYVLAPGQTKVYDGLAQSEEFARDFELNMEDSLSPELYITRYKRVAETKTC